MLHIRTENLKPGMIVARSILGVDGTVLLPADSRLNHQYILRLRKLDIPSLYIRDKRTSDLDLIGPVLESTQRKAAGNIRAFFKKLPGKTSLDSYLPSVKESVDILLQDILSSGCSVLTSFAIKNFSDYLYLHSVNVAILSLLIGIKQDLANDQLHKLGMAAILHDIGKVMVPGSVLGKLGSLSPGEYQQMQKHTTLGYDLLQKTSKLERNTAITALQHHERLDGRGYPQGLEGEQISYSARIVAICDVFDALISDRNHRKRYQPHTAAEYIMGAGGTLFDYHLVQSFLSCIAVYPLGTPVKLNTGHSGVVMRIKEINPANPIVRILRDKRGEEILHPYEIDLSSNPHFFITAIHS